MSSPFDEAALKQPFLDEKPIIKRLPNFSFFKKEEQRDIPDDDEEQALLPSQIDEETVIPTETTRTVEILEIEHDLQDPSGKGNLNLNLIQIDAIQKSKRVCKITDYY